MLSHPFLMDKGLINLFDNNSLDGFLTRLLSPLMTPVLQNITGYIGVCFVTLGYLGSLNLHDSISAGGALNPFVVF